MQTKKLTFKEIAKKLKISVDKVRIIASRSEFQRFVTKAYAYSSKGNYFYTVNGLFYNKDFINQYRSIYEYNT